MFNKKVITLLGVGFIGFSGFGVLNNHTIVAASSTSQNKITKNNGLKLLKKAGYKSSQLKNTELLNSSSKMTTINTYKKTQNKWIKNTYTLYPQGSKMVEIHLQSYKGTNKNDPASFQDKITPTGAAEITINRNNYKVTSQKASNSTQSTTSNNAETGQGVPKDLQGEYNDHIIITNKSVGSGTAVSTIMVHSYEKKETFIHSMGTV